MKLFRLLRGALIWFSAVTAPWLAVAGAYNIVQNDNGTTGLLDSLAVSAIQGMTFLGNGQITRMSAANGTGVPVWSFDEKEYTLMFADIGTASDASLVIAETGIIMEASIAWPQTLTGSNAVITAVRVAQNGNFSAPVTISSLSLTAPTASVSGGKVTDDTIFQAVGRGDVVTFITDGGPSNVVPGFVTVRVRAAPVQ